VPNLNLALPFGEAPLAEPPAGRNPLLRQDASLEKVVEQMEAMQQREGGPITAIRHQPAREAKFVDLPAKVDGRLTDVLARCDILKLYSHQGDAFDKITAGENVVIVTPTASSEFNTGRL
jgi:DEAD/DEAH box helicase domain-containing protein